MPHRLFQPSGRDKLNWVALLDNECPKCGRMLEEVTFLDIRKCEDSDICGFVITERKLRELTPELIREKEKQEAQKEGDNLPLTNLTK